MSLGRMAIGLIQVMRAAALAGIAGLSGLQAAPQAEVAEFNVRLTSPAFLDVATHPEIAFRSRRIEKVGAGYLLVGDLSLHGVEREVVQAGVRLLGLHGVAEHPLRLVPLVLCQLQHRRIHAGVLVRLAFEGGSEVLGGRADRVEGLEVTLGVDPLRLGGGPEQSGHVREAVVLRLLRERAVLLRRLTLSCEGLGQIGLRAGHLGSPVRGAW